MKYFILILLVLGASVAQAQWMEGLVLDVDTKEPIIGATVINRHSHTITLTDNSGHYTIQISAGDTVIFSHTSYKSVTEVVPFSIGNRHESIQMKQNVYKLQETTVTGLTDYQEDSIKNREEYVQPLRQTPGKVNTYGGFGVATEGLISRWVGNMTGYNQKQKKFEKTFATGEQNIYIDTRYTLRLVEQLTGLGGDEAARFMNTYPMPYDFARAASDLELKMWIKHNYKEYSAKHANAK